nr:P1 [Caladenia virus A]
MATPTLQWVPKRSLKQEMNNTILHFQNEEDARWYVTRTANGGLFKTMKGNATQVALNLLLAAHHNLAFDVASEHFVCAKCKCASKSLSYFKKKHDSETCTWYMENKQASVSYGNGLIEVIPTYDAFPMYATPAQVTHAIAQLENALAFQELGPIDVVEVKFFNSKTQETEVRTRAIPDSTTHLIAADQCTSFLEPKVNQCNLRNVVNKRRIIVDSKTICDLTQQVVDICNEKQIPLVFVDHERKMRRFPRIPLHHHVDLTCDPLHDMYEECQHFVKTYASVAQPLTEVEDLHITKGWSGIILHKEDLPDKYKGDCVDGLFVIQGRCIHGNLQNALKPTCTEGLVFY